MDLAWGSVGGVSWDRRRHRHRIGRRRLRQWHCALRCASITKGRLACDSSRRREACKGHRRARAAVNSHRHGASIQGEPLREKTLSDLASRAATDVGFLKRARRDLEGTLAAFGYDLTLEELRWVEDFRRRTAGMSDEQLARTLASGLRGRTGIPPARPAAPSWRGSGPSRPARPGD